MEANAYETPKLPVDAQEAKVLAAEHLAYLPPPQGWTYAETVGRELEHDWYFDYCLTPASAATNQEELFGGAAGFYISKTTGEIRIAVSPPPLIEGVTK